MLNIYWYFYLLLLLIRLDHCSLNRPENFILETIVAILRIALQPQSLCMSSAVSLLEFCLYFEFLVYAIVKFRLHNFSMDLGLIENSFESSILNRWLIYFPPFRWIISVTSQIVGLSTAATLATLLCIVRNWGHFCDIADHFKVDVIQMHWISSNLEFDWIKQNNKYKTYRIINLDL